jgi:RHS repeat-associated protein
LSIGKSSCVPQISELLTLAGDFTAAKVVEVKRGEKFFEWSNHLGNVLATVSDRKIAHSSNSSMIDYYTADVISAQDYYPFGMIMPGRTVVNGNGYRYGFNGVEIDNEVAGESGHLDFRFRGYDPRVGRFWSVDPLYQTFPWNSTYAFAENSTIRFLDLEGAERYDYTYKLNTELGKAELQKVTETDIDEKGNKLPLSFNYTLNGRNTTASTIDQFNNRTDNDPLTNSALEKLFRDYKENGGKFPEDYYADFGKHIFNTSISQSSQKQKDATIGISKGIVKAINFIDNEENFGGGRFATVYHAYEILVGTNENTGYDKLMHFTFSAAKTFSFGRKVGLGLGYMKEGIKDEAYSWLPFVKDKGWDNLDIKANKAGVQFGSQLRSKYGKSLGDSMIINPPSNEKLPQK